MSKFIPRNIKTSEASERPKEGNRLLSKRGSLEMNDKVNLLISSSMSNYNDSLPIFSGTVNRFFSSTKASESQTVRVSHKSSSVSRNFNSSQDQPRNDSNKFWEISERIETLEIRLAQNPDTNPQSKLLLWKNCSNEVISLVKRDYSELAIGLGRLVKGFLTALEEISAEFQMEQNRKIKLIQEQIDLNKEKSDQILRLQSQIQDFKEIKLSEARKIESEIRELFGEYSDEQEIDEARARCNALLKNKPSEIVPLLKGVYKDMRKNRELPDFNDNEIDQPNPDDISKALRFNFSLILQASTKKAMNLLRKDIKTKLVSTQTMIACVSVEEYQELLKKLEKTSFSQQTLQIQLEKYRDELMQKIQSAEKAEIDKNQAFTQMLKCKREADVYLKELTALKKEFEKVSIEKEKTVNELDAKTKNLNKLQDRFNNIENKLKKIVNNPAAPQTLVKDKEKNTPVMSREGSDPNLTIINNEVIKYKGYPKPPEKKRNSRSNLYDNKLNIYNSGLGKKQMSKSNYSSRSSLMDDYIDYMNKPTKTKIPVDSSKPGQKRNSLNSNDNSPTSKGTDTLNEHKNYTEDGQSPINPAKRQIKISIIQPNESEELIPGDKSPKKNKKKKDKKKGQKFENGKEKSSPKRMSTKLNEDNEKIQDKGKIEMHSENYCVQRSVERDGKTLILKDQSTCTVDNISTFCSIATQCGQSEDEDKQKDSQSMAGIFHFNPNNYFGFRGDVFYNSGQVFVAQPKIPDYSMCFEKK